MNLKISIMEKNPCYTAGTKIEVKGLMLHSVGCPQPDASVFIRNWNTTSYKTACVHAFIDGNNGTVYQTLPWNHRGWHCGGNANNTHVGVEMCEPGTISYTAGSAFTVRDRNDAQAVAKRTYDAAVELFAYLCKEYSLDPLKDGVIISHKEGSSRGVATNHGDPEHLWTQLGLPYTMNTFRAAVKAKMSGGTVTTPDKSTSATTNSNRKISNADCPILVHVNTPLLNIRKAPGTNYEKTGEIKDKGTYTITEIKSGQGADMGWGKLKSGLGWISLDYCTWD